MGRAVGRDRGQQVVPVGIAVGYRPCKRLNWAGSAGNAADRQLPARRGLTQVQKIPTLLFEVTLSLGWKKHKTWNKQQYHGCHETYERGKD